MAHLDVDDLIPAIDLFDLDTVKRYPPSPPLGGYRDTLREKLLRDPAYRRYEATRRPR